MPLDSHAFSSGILMCAAVPLRFHGGLRDVLEAFYRFLSDAGNVWYLVNNPAVALIVAIEPLYLEDHSPVYGRFITALRDYSNLVINNTPRKRGESAAAYAERKSALHLVKKAFFTRAAQHKKCGYSAVCYQQQLPLRLTWHALQTSCANWAQQVASSQVVGTPIWLWMHSVKPPRTPSAGRFASGVVHGFVRPGAVPCSCGSTVTPGHPVAESAVPSTFSSVDVLLEAIEGAECSTRWSAPSSVESRAGSPAFTACATP